MKIIVIAIHIIEVVIFLALAANRLGWVELHGWVLWILWAAFVVILVVLVIGWFVVKVMNVQ